MSELTLIPPTRDAIIKHALVEYPKESCGLIVDGDYKPCFNYATLPEQDFCIASDVMQKAYLTGKLQAVVHSHPDGPSFPSELDMQSQISTAVPWIIVPVDRERVLPFTIWGDQLPIAPVIGREFMHGVYDCYSLIRDVFRLGRDELAKQGVDWPLPATILTNMPRDDNWWSDTPERKAKNLYVDNFESAGFKKIAREEVRPGDVFLCKIKSEHLNHGGVVVGGGMILHHLPTRLSRREAAGIWQRAADLWIRHIDTEQSYVAS